MELVGITVLALRLVVPLSILRWPLAGMFLSIAADAVDVMIFEKFGGGFWGDNYHAADKILDVYYLFFAFIVAHKWRDALARRTAKILFLWRFVGFAVFELTGIRAAFFFAPAIFENFYVVWIVILKFAPQFRLTPLRLAILLLAAGIPKTAQEYVMHFKYPDQTWHFLRDNIFWWVYK
jgi:hypothetical protein